MAYKDISEENKLWGRIMTRISLALLVALCSYTIYSIQRQDLWRDSVNAKFHEQDIALQKKAEPCQVREIFVDEISKWELKLRQNGENVMIMKKQP